MAAAAAAAGGARSGGELEGAAPRAPPSCFSPTVSVNITGLALSTATGFQLSLVFDSNDLNARLLLPLGVGLTWGGQEEGAGAKE